MLQITKIFHTIQMNSILPRTQIEDIYKINALISLQVCVKIYKKDCKDFFERK